MSSSPSTPSAELPSDASQHRFHQIGTATEWAEEYRPGRFHPIHFGDLFKDGRYKVIRKIGYGSFSTVWLAVDRNLACYVALKVLVAKESPTSKELPILEHIAKLSASYPGSEHIISMLDSFTHKGPNGTHLCLIFEPMGGTAASIRETLPCNLPHRQGRVARYPLWMAKRILRHTLIALDFLHQVGIVHGDIQPGNLLFSIANLNDISEETLEQGRSPSEISKPLERKDGKNDKWAPAYLAIPQPLEKYVDTGPGLGVKVSDVGAAFFASSPPTKPVTPKGLRAPELILTSFPLTSSIDIWSFGCLVFEFVTGTSLFALDLYGATEEEIDDDHLLMMTDVLGKLPDHMFSEWARAKKYFGEGGKRISSATTEDMEDEEEEPYISDDLEKSFRENKSDEVDEEQTSIIISVIREIMQYDPRKRPSAGELLKHPWFKEDINLEK
ncbi:hypothetical protein ONS95_013391 [Cadophora gregata]|uniref:uncharacterized protein n=1 Tax=Cadophora gregata TaxID=51156 RepID=UPI0026DB47B9|nr:uncharacterized protein ONS95_013391 [Cadophora gregata]KAK0099716.1 hypothetical protein ONS96_008213 [Cadophora gregata f. sp. sojae]KAK0116371.1 hypothetical protein ONS95_013391 [Cadophora gregata]